MTYSWGLHCHERTKTTAAPCRLLRQTYCPILRLSTHPRSLIWTNASGKPKVLGFDSDCRTLDQLLSDIHSRQSADLDMQVPYLPMDQQVSDAQLLTDAWLRLV